MAFIYNTIILIAGVLLRVFSLFSPKLRLFLKGREEPFERIKSSINASDLTVWFHAASLGEYEQGLPIIEAVKLHYPNHKIILSFFSPSGYEVRKNNTVANLTMYLPLDTQKNAKEFIKLVHPKMAFFIKYEYWPNYLNELSAAQTPTYLISGIFRQNQLFFKWYGGFYRKSLNSFDHFFVQNELSQKLLEKLKKNNVTISGDTRFDRVSEIVNNDNFLDFAANFKNNQQTIIIGSSWPKDEQILVSYINKSIDVTKYIIAPHNIKSEQIQKLKNSISKKVVCYSETANKDLSTYEVLIIDNIGLLTKLYSYADIAYVGGGFGSPGVHNILEPATYGIPIVIGPNYDHFDEAVGLIKLKGCTSIKNLNELETTFIKLTENQTLRKAQGSICANFVQENKGATERIMQYLAKKTT